MNADVCFGPRSEWICDFAIASRCEKLLKKFAMTPKVPNYNALSSLLDRLAIENIKLSFFENALEHDPLDDATRKEFEGKAESQRKMIDVLRNDTVDCMEGKYDCVAEGRTFSDD